MDMREEECKGMWRRRESARARERVLMGKVKDAVQSLRPETLWAKGVFHMDI